MDRYKKLGAIQVCLVYAGASLAFTVLVVVLLNAILGRAEDKFADLVPVLDSFTAVEKIQIPLERLIADVETFEAGNARSVAELNRRFDIVMAKYSILAIDSPLGRSFSKSTTVEGGIEDIGRQL